MTVNRDMLFSIGWHLRMTLRTGRGRVVVGDRAAALADPAQQARGIAGDFLVAGDREPRLAWSLLAHCCISLSASTAASLRSTSLVAVSSVIGPRSDSVTRCCQARSWSLSASSAR